MSYQEKYNLDLKHFGPDIADLRKRLWNYGEIINAILDLEQTPQTYETINLIQNQMNSTRIQFKDRYKNWPPPPPPLLHPK
jgi:hypothetical protein